MSEPVRGQPGDNRSPEAIERDIERTRAALADTLTALSGRLSPGRVMDTVLSDVRHNVGADFLRALRDSIRDNPVPVAVAAVGLVWLMVATERPQRSSRPAAPMRRAVTPATERDRPERTRAAEPVVTGPDDDPSVVAPVTPPPPSHAEERRR